MIKSLTSWRQIKDLGWRIVRSNFGRLNHPFKLTFCLTWRCNSRCSFCNIWKKEPVRELTAAEISLFFKKNPHFSWIDLTGGEVFLRPDLVEIIRLIRQNNPGLYLLHFPTNGLLPDLISQKVEEISKLGLPNLIVSISLDGPPELHDRLRGIPGGWQKAVATYQKLKGLGVEVYFGMTLAEENIDQLESTYRQLKEEIPRLSYRDLHLNIAHASPHYYGNKDQAVSHQTGKIEKTIRGFRQKRGVSLSPVFLLEDAYLKRLPAYLKTGRTPRPCQALSGSFFLDPSGIVYPCSIFDRPVGDLRTVGLDLQKIWPKEETIKTYQEIQRGGCPHCWTPCESYQGILGSLWPSSSNRRVGSPLME